VKSTCVAAQGQSPCPADEARERLGLNLAASRKTVTYSLLRRYPRMIATVPLMSATAPSA
jgi:hypothetical protein